MKDLRIMFTKKQLDFIRKAINREWYVCKDDWDAEWMDLVEDIDKKIGSIIELYKV